MGRIDRVNEQMKRELGSIIQREMNDPRLEFVTITKVDTSKDLRHARVYFSVLGDPSQVEIALEALEGARGTIRKYVGQRLTMRYTPDLSFMFDETVEYSARIEETLQEIHDEYEKNHPNDQAE